MADSVLLMLLVSWVIDWPCDAILPSALDTRVVSELSALASALLFTTPVRVDRSLVSLVIAWP